MNFEKLFLGSLQVLLAYFLGRILGYIFCFFLMIGLCGWAIYKVIHLPPVVYNNSTNYFSNPSPHPSPLPARTIRH